MERPRLDVELLMAHALGVPRMQLYLQFDRPLGPDELEAIRDLVRRRGQGIPVAYLLGHWGFHALDLEVDGRVLVPRPETETLVDAALERCATREAPVLLDVGTGSGCIALAVAHALPTATVLASDVSAEALEVARANAERLGLAARVTFAQGDLLAPWRGHAHHGRLDAVLSNPPYIVRGDPTLEAAVARHEPDVALYVEGGDPLAIARRLADEARAALAPGGWLLIEIGHESGEAAHTMLRDLAYEDVSVQPDLAGIPRVALGRRAAS